MDQDLMVGVDTAELANFKSLLGQLLPLNRTIVSDDMERAADLLDQAVEIPATRYRYPSGTEYGSWVVPPSWNVREAFLSDGDRTIVSFRDHVLFVAPYSVPFEGWISRAELLAHVVTSDVFDDAFVYEHRLAVDFQRRLRDWRLSLPRRVLDTLNREQYFVKIDVDLHPGTMNVLEYTLPGEEPIAVGLLSHLCHSGQANDGLSGVLAGIALLRRVAARPHRLTYKLLVMPETVGSVTHVIAQGLSTAHFLYTVFLETMASGERLYLKKTRTGDRPVDLAIDSLVREQPSVGALGFFEGYGNDELMFDFANVGIPSAGVQHFPFKEYHTSRDNADLIDWGQWLRTVDLTEELLRRMEANRVIRLKYPGPPYLTRYGLYADAVHERPRFQQVRKLLTFCDGHHSLLAMCEESKLPFWDVVRFFEALEHAGLLEAAP